MRDARCSNALPAGDVCVTNPMNLLAKLPPALLVHDVLTKLSQTDLLALTTSCVTLLRMVEHYAHVLHVWSAVRIPGGNASKRKSDEPDASLSRVTLLKRRAACVQSLTVQCFRACNDDFAMALHCPHLRHLDVRSLQPMYFTADMLELVSKQCPHVVSLGVHPSAFVDGPKTALFPKLTKLVIAGGKTTDIQSYFTFPLHQLQELHMVDFGLCHGVILSLCINLKVLSIVRCWRTGSWMFDDHPFHVDDTLFASNLRQLESFTLCSSDSVFCTNSAFDSIFGRSTWRQLHTLVVDSAFVPHVVCNLSVKYAANDFVCLHCTVRASETDGLRYNMHYKDSTVLITYARCASCRAKHASNVRSMSILWW